MNQKRPSVGSAHPTKCRLIIDSPASGAWNMAVDETLLIDAAERGVATLRFYCWSEPTLSLGYFQHRADRHRHVASLECAAVRRQTGGGAILHDGELTYSLTLPAGHPLARQTETLYAAVHEAFIAVLTPLIAASSAGGPLVRREERASLATNDEPFLCFQRRARGDVLFISPGAESSADANPPSAPRAEPPDWKVLGSAQRRHRGAILQHGSLLLEKSAAAPELPGLRDLSGLDSARAELAVALSVRLATALDAHLSESGLSSELESKARELTHSKYGTPAWTNRR